MKTNPNIAEIAGASQCPVCESRSHTELFCKDARCYVRCADCGVAYSLPRPGEEQLTGLYDEIGEEYFTDPRMLAFYFEPHRFERELGFIARHLSPPSRLMDVGCCVGAFVAAAQAAGYEASGIDISTAAVNYGQSRGLRLRVENMLTTAYPEPLDAVSLWNVLEHVPSPRAFLGKSFEVLRPGGFLFASVPNFQSLSQRLLNARHNLVCVEHLNYFTPRTFAETVATAGFEVKAIRSIGFNPIAMVRDWVHGGTQLERSEQVERAAMTLKVVSSPLRRIQRCAEWLLDRTNHAADVVMIAAQKPSGAPLVVTQGATRSGRR
jgi:2-polyprenyl-3-methyl-5-hydroxy-6-metoxy-1,4-benzoquinol methylase/Zn ribbon nucleic-acid-binding protein